MSTKNRLFIPGYKRLEYISIPLGGYLEFDVTNTQDTRWLADMKYIPAATTQAYPWIGGFRTYVGGNGVAKQIIELVHSNTAILYTQYSGNTEQYITVSSSFDSRGRHVYEWNANNVLVDGTVVKTETAETFTGTDKLKIGGVSSSSASGGVSVNFTGNCYKVQCWKDGVSQDIDAIPVQRLSDNAIGMYDQVTRTFCGNLGTGTFVAGPEIEQVEYIESSGTQYIDTGLLPTTVDTLECDFAFTDYTSYGNIITSQYGGTSHRILRLNNNNHYLQWSAQASIVDNIGGVTLNQKYHINWHYETDNSWIKIDGVQKATATGVLTDLSRAYSIFANSDGTYLSKAKCYGAKVNTLNGSCDLIPVLVGTEYAMFDIVTNTVYRNAGTGAFTGGNIVPEPSFIPFTSMRLSRYANATSADATKYPQTLSGYDAVDMGTLSWAKSDTYQNTFLATLPGAAPSGWAVVGHIYTARYETDTVNAVVGSGGNGKIGIDPSSQIYVKDITFSTVADFRASMSGEILLYQLATSDSSVWNFACDTATKTKNLFDGGERGDYSAATGEKTASGAKYRSKNKIPVVAGQTYSNNIINAPSWVIFNKLNVYGYDAKGAFIWNKTTGSIPDQHWAVGGTLTMPENTAYITVSTFGTDVNSDERVAELDEKLIIVEGSTVPSTYEPYGNIFGYRNQATGEFVKAFGATGTVTSYDKIEFLSTWFKQGKNLFDGTSNLVFGKYIYVSTGAIESNNSNFYCETYFEIKPNTSYVFFGENKTDGTYAQFNRIHFYDADKTFVSSAYGVRSEKANGVSPSNAKYVRISCNPLGGGTTLKPADLDLFNWYFGEGNAATPYEPYSYKQIQFTNNYYT